MDESADEGEEEQEPQHPEVDEEREELTAQRRKEIEAIQRAMDEENERVGTAQSRQSTSREEEAEHKLYRGKPSFLFFIYPKCFPARTLCKIASHNVPRFVSSCLS